jgi:hypothetical protein
MKEAVDWFGGDIKGARGSHSRACGQGLSYSAKRKRTQSGL